MSPIFSDALLKCLCYKLKFILTKANIISSSPSSSPSSLAPLPAISNDITINEINIVELFFQQNTIAVNREWDSSLSSSWPRHEILCMHCCLYSATRKKNQKILCICNWRTFKCQCVWLYPVFPTKSEKCWLLLFFFLSAKNDRLKV